MEISKQNDLSKRITKCPKLVSFLSKFSEDFDTVFLIRSNLLCDHKNIGIIGLILKHRDLKIGSSFFGIIIIGKNAKMVNLVILEIQIFSIIFEKKW